MKKYRCILNFIALCTALLLSPGESVSQLSKADSAAVFTLIDKAEFFFGEEKYDSALFYTTKAENLSRQSGFKKGQAYALIEAADIYIDKDEAEKAEANTAAANKIGLQLKDSLITAITWMQMAQIKMYADRFDDAVPLFEKSLRYYPANHPTVYAALAYNDLGYTRGRKGDLTGQAEALIKSISIYEKYFPSKYGELGIALSNLSTVYYSLDQKLKAIEYAKRSLAYREKAGDISRLSLGCCNISQYYIGINNDEAEKYLQLCVKYALQVNREDRIIHSYVTAGHLYATNKKPEEALVYELKAIDLLEKSKKDPEMLARRYIAAGTQCAALKKDTALTMSYYNKSLALLLSLPGKGNLRDLYLQLSNYYKDNGEYNRALQYYKKFVLYKDSIVSEKTTSAIAEIETRYETKKKDAEISRLNTDKKIRQLEIEKQKAVIAGNIAEAKQKQNEITLLSQQRELQDVKIKQQGEELEKQALLAKNNEQQLQISKQEKNIDESRLRSQKLLRNFMIGGIIALLLLAGFIFNRYQLKRKLDRQKEMMAMRNEIARDLHDDIGSALTSIRILSEVSKNNLRKDSAKAALMLTEITEQSDRMQQSMSDIVWAIKPDNDRLENMLVRMREYAAFVLEPKNIKVSFETDEQILNKSIDMQQRRDVLMIFKEALNNVTKHSRASEVKISVFREAGKMIMEIRDNGTGFEAGIKTSSNGLGNMRSRAEGLGGKANIISEKNKGTAVIAELPLHDYAG